MKTKLLLYTVSMLLVLAMMQSCREIETPEVYTGNTVFMVTGDVNGGPLTMTAGKQEYYLFTGYHTDTTGVIEFRGTLKAGCSGCNEALEIRLRNHTIGNYNPDSVFTPGSRVYYSFNNDPTYQVKFVSQAGGPGTADHLWDFGDGTVSTLSDPVKEYIQPGDYLVKYRATYPGGSMSEISYLVRVSPSHTGNNRAVIQVIGIDSAEFEFQTDTAAANLWDFGDGNTGSGTQVSHKYTSHGLYKVCLTKYFSADSAYACKNVPTANYTGAVANFDYMVTQITDPGFQFSRVIVEWVDPAGNRYSSAGITQETSSYFRILSSSPYDRNEHGQQVRKFEFEAGCRLYDGTKSIRINNLRGTFGVATP